MEEKGNALVEEIVAGNSAVFNQSVMSGTDVETAVLVALQTDFAGWLGFKQFCEALVVGERRPQ